MFSWKGLRKFRTRVSKSLEVSTISQQIQIETDLQIETQFHN